MNNIVLYLDSSYIKIGQYCNVIKEFEEHYTKVCLVEIEDEQLEKLIKKYDYDEVATFTKTDFIYSYEGAQLIRNFYKMKENETGIDDTELCKAICEFYNLNPKQVEFVYDPNDSYDDLKLAVTMNGYNVLSIPNPSDELLDLAVEHCSYIIDDLPVEKRTEKRLWIYIKDNPIKIEHFSLSETTPEMITYCLSDEANTSKRYGRLGVVRLLTKKYPKDPATVKILEDIFKMDNRYAYDVIDEKFGKQMMKKYKINNYDHSLTVLSRLSAIL